MRLKCFKELATCRLGTLQACGEVPAIRVSIDAPTVVSKRLYHFFENFHSDPLKMFLSISMFNQSTISNALEVKSDRAAHNSADDQRANPNDSWIYFRFIHLPFNV